MCNSLSYFPFWYIDDVSFNFEGEFNDTTVSIYPGCLTLKKSCNSDRNDFVDFLDLQF